jgi:hypothetical protein
LILASVLALSTTLFVANPTSGPIDVAFAASIGMLAGMAVYGLRKGFGVLAEIRRKP